MTKQMWNVYLDDGNGIYKVLCDAPPSRDEKTIVFIDPEDGFVAQFWASSVKFLARQDRIDVVTGPIGSKFERIESLAGYEKPRPAVDMSKWQRDHGEPFISVPGPVDLSEVRDGLQERVSRYGEAPVAAPNLEEIVDKWSDAKAHTLLTDDRHDWDQNK